MGQLSFAIKGTIFFSSPQPTGVPHIKPRPEAFFMPPPVRRERARAAADDVGGESARERTKGVGQGGWKWQQGSRMGRGVGVRRMERTKRTISEKRDLPAMMFV